MPSTKGSSNRRSSLGVDGVELEKQAEADLLRFRKGLKLLRDQRALGHFIELEEAVGLRTGSISRFLRGDRDLPVGKVVKIIRALREDPGLFFSRVYSALDRRPGLCGLLLLSAGEEGCKERPGWLDPLLGWGGSVVLSPEGRVFDFDHSRLLDLRRWDFAAAERVGIAAIEYFMTAADGTLATASAAPFARWISTVALILRVRGQRAAAAHLFDLAFAIEVELGDPACRSFIARNACYLLGDWGHFSEACRGLSFRDQALPETG